MGTPQERRARTPLPADASDGGWWLDGVRPRPDPEPLATIGWRIAHLILGSWNWLSSLKELGPRPEPGLLGNVGSLLPLWRSVLDDFTSAVKAFNDEDLARDVQAGTSRIPRMWIVSHMTPEIAAHGAEVGTMRHLYRTMPGA